MSVEDMPREMGVADPAFRAAWVSDFAGYMTEAAEHLRQTAMYAEQQCYEAVVEEDQGKPIGAEGRRLVARTRAMSLASALLALFAIELALKAHQIRDCGQHKNWHDLQKLFDSLNEETKTRLKKLGPEVTETLRNHRKGFVSLRYPFEELFSLNSVVIPRPSDPLHAVATKIREALIE